MTVIYPADWQQDKAETSRLPRNEKAQKMKFYLAGPMQHIPEFNFPAFHAFAAKMRSMGAEVFSPAERDIARHNGVDVSKGNETGDVALCTAQHGFSLRDALADDTAYICKEADAIAMMPGWENSKGARAEHALAVALGLDIVYLVDSFLEA